MKTALSAIAVLAALFTTALPAAAQAVPQQPSAGSVGPAIETAAVKKRKKAVKKPTKKEVRPAGNKKK